MKRTLYKALFILLMVVTILNVGLSSVFAQSSGFPAQRPNDIQETIATDSPTYVALGDSITTGYGLSGYTAPTPTKPAYASESFVELLTVNKKFISTNLAVDGLTSEQLAIATNPNAMNAVQKAMLQKASVISVTIGGNDLLHTFYNAMATAMGITVTPENMPLIMETVLAGLSGIEGSETQAQQLAIALQSVVSKIPAVAGNFGAQLNTIVTNVKTLNPTATLVLQTIANPYKHVDEAIAGLLDMALTTFNTIIINGAKTKAYRVADVFAAFQNSSEILTNATNPLMPLDPHPNAKGHKIIADLMFEQWELSLMKTEVTTPLDLSTMGSTDKLAAEGWKWDKASKTLTLDGIHMKVALENGEAGKYTYAILLPSGSSVVAKAGSVNKITATNKPQTGYQAVILNADINSKEGFTFTGTGSLTLAQECSSFSDVIRANMGAIKIEGMPNFNIISTSNGAEFSGPIGISASKTRISNSSVNLQTGNSAIVGDEINIIDSTLTAKSKTNEAINIAHPNEENALIKNSTVNIEGATYGWKQMQSKLIIDNSIVNATGGTQNGIYSWKSSGDIHGVDILHQSKVTAVGKTGAPGIQMNSGNLTVDNSELIVDKNTTNPSIVAKKVQFKGASKVALSGNTSFIKQHSENAKCEIIVSEGTTVFSNGFKLAATQEFTIHAKGNVAIPEGKAFENNGILTNKGTLSLNNANSYTGSGTLSCNSDAAKSENGHQYLLERASGKPTIPATCTTTGLAYYLCDLCNAEIRITLAPTGHAYKNEWLNDETNHWQECASDGALSDRAAHTFGEWIMDASATEAVAGSRHRDCSVCKYREIVTIPAVPHTHTPSTEWSKDTKNHWHNCTANDGERMHEALHTWDDGKITTPPTFTQDGVKTYTCNVCGQTKIMTISKLASNSVLVDNATGIKVAYADGTSFDSSIILNVISQPQTVMDTYAKNIHKAEPHFVLEGLYNISLLKNGAIIQPNGKVKISIPLTEKMKSMTELQIVHIDDNGIITIIPSQVINEEIVFVTNRLNNFGIINKHYDNSNSPQTGDNTFIVLFTFIVLISGTTLGMLTQKRRIFK